MGGDWYDWWFGRNSTKLKKGVGIAIVALIGMLVAKANYNIDYDLQVSASLFAVLAINILIILLPILRGRRNFTRTRNRIFNTSNAKAESKRFAGLYQSS